MAGLENRLSFLGEGDLIFLSNPGGFSVGGYVVGCGERKIELSKEDPSNYWSHWLMFELGVRGWHVDFDALTPGNMTYDLSYFDDYSCLYPQDLEAYDMFFLPYFKDNLICLSSDSLNLNVTGFLKSFWKDWNEVYFMGVSLESAKSTRTNRVFSPYFFDKFVVLN